MTDDAQPERDPDWRNARSYEPMLALDRRAWAWECLRRNEEFSTLLASMTPVTTCIMRDDPLITIVTLPRDDRLNPWGLHFRPTAGPSPGDELCRVACRL
jgi:hypothetical protein